MEKQNKFVLWLKNYGAYLTAGVLVVAIAGVVFLTGINSASQQMSHSGAGTATVDVSAKPLTFSMPMANATLMKDYSSEELYLNSTLGRWEFHDGIDFASADQKVYAVADGEVLNVETTDLNGTIVTIKHSNKLQSAYASLSPDVAVKKGDKVKAGDVLGEADNTASNEANDGKHLHFSMIEDGKKIDPANYLEFEVK